MPANIRVPEGGESIVDAGVATWLKKRRRPERGAKRPSESAWGRGRKRIE
jgi:hypothetical protein